MSFGEPRGTPDWPEGVPCFVRRVFLLGCGSGAEGLRLKQRLGIEVYGVVSGPAAAAARERLDGVLEDPWWGDSFPFPCGYFDCVLLPEPLACPDTLGETLSRLVPILNDSGVLLALRDGLSGSEQAEFEAGVAEAGWGVYGTTAHFVIGVKPEYNPVVHARALFDAGLPRLGLEVLAHVPVTYFEKPAANAVLSTEMLMCVLAWDAQEGPAERLARFTRAQVFFHRAVSHRPEVADPYQCMAEFWRRLGNPDMAGRLLRSILHIVPSESAARQLDALGEDAPVSAVEYVPPNWRPPSCLPRVLFVTPSQPNYELDVLYDGLCAVLGEDNVVEFPYKETLHGRVPGVFSHYPCLFNRPGTSWTVDEVCAGLREGRFDFVLYGDTERGLDEETARRIAASARATPLFVVDGADDPGNNLPAVLEHLGIESVKAYFKREMLTCGRYPSNTIPLPFAYADGRVPVAIFGARPRGLFWAGHRCSGMRRLYLEHVERLLSEELKASYLQEEYVQALAESQLGLNLFGGGFDTVRYWELPAHGCMLLSERLPIHIPLNFRDGESAVFFDDLPGLEWRLRHYLAHPDEVRRIAMAGHEHLRRHHTGSARARQLLGWIQNALLRD